MLAGRAWAELALAQAALDQAWVRDRSGSMDMHPAYPRVAWAVGTFHRRPREAASHPAWAYAQEYVWAVASRRTAVQAQAGSPGVWVAVHLDTRCTGRREPWVRVLA